MRAATLTQPWAGLVASGIKLVENRPRPMIRRDFIGKRFAIHASRELDESVFEHIARARPDLLQKGGDIAKIRAQRWYQLAEITSAVIGVATLDSIVTAGTLGSVNWCEIPEDQRRWAFGPVCYVLRDVHALLEPVPCRGWQGFWELPFEIDALVRKQLRRCGAMGVDNGPPGDREVHCVRCGLVADPDSECPPGFVTELGGQVAS